LDVIIYFCFEHHHQFDKQFFEGKNSFVEVHAHVAAVMLDVLNIKVGLIWFFGKPFFIDHIGQTKFLIYDIHYGLQIFKKGNVVVLNDL
jgi:hypothetical protein